MKALELLPPVDMMYRALLNRDSSFEGIFFVGVRTTGIFCRPTCPAKKPARTNVDFFATPAQAIDGGYRPCLRCQPMDSSRPAVFVRRLHGYLVVRQLQQNRKNACWPNESILRWAP